MREVSHEELRKAVEATHGGKATWRSSVPVRETFQGRIVWEGAVQVFDLAEHPSATMAYAWSHETGKAKTRRFHVVLAVGPIRTPLDAVRAAIVAEHKGT